MSKILRVFSGVNLNCQHNGLKDLAKKFGIDVTVLENGEFIVFINNAKNRIKIFTSNNTIAYYRSPDDSKIELRTIALIPKFFDGKKIRYEEGLEEWLTAALRSKSKGIVQYIS